MRGGEPAALVQGKMSTPRATAGCHCEILYSKRGYFFCCILFQDGRGVGCSSTAGEFF